MEKYPMESLKETAFQFVAIPSFPSKPRETGPFPAEIEEALEEGS